MFIRCEGNVVFTSIHVASKEKIITRPINHGCLGHTLYSCSLICRASPVLGLRRYIQAINTPASEITAAGTPTPSPILSDVAKPPLDDEPCESWLDVLNALDVLDVAAFP